MISPRCQWSSCNREMKLARETPDCWVFICPACRCVRVLVKDSIKDMAQRRALERQMEQLKQLQESRERKREYSFGGQA
jgi:hypothetical protein